MTHVCGPSQSRKSRGLAAAQNDSEKLGAPGSRLFWR
jgi:hypothetical protein